MFGLDVILGGITGLLGNVVSGVLNYKTLKAKQEHEQKMLELKTARDRERTKLQIELSKAETQATIELSDAEVYKESIKSASRPSFSEQWIDKLLEVEGKWRFISIPTSVFLMVLFGFVDWIRTLMRPALTAYLVGLSTVVTWMAWDVLKQYNVEAIGVDDAIGIFRQTISIVTYLTVSCVTWWFGDRRIAKFLQKLDLGSNNQDSPPF